MQSTYQEVLSITQDYLGPAADRFLARQAHFHLHKHPEQITREDIPALAEWVKVSIAILTEDKELVDEFGQRINSIIR